jgi:hypothetical protein
LVGYDDLGVEGRAHVEEVTHIVAMGCWRARVEGGRTRSEEQTESGEDTEETHYRTRRRGEEGILFSTQHKGMRVDEDGEPTRMKIGAIL